MTNVYREARIAARMTQPHLAQAAGVSISTVRRLEKDVSVGFESMRAVGSVLGLDVTQILASAEVSATDETPMPKTDQADAVSRSSVGHGRPTRANEADAMVGGTPFIPVLMILSALWLTLAASLGSEPSFGPVFALHFMAGGSLIGTVVVFGPAVLRSGFLTGIAEMSGGAALVMATWPGSSGFEPVLLPCLAIDAYLTLRMFGVFGRATRCPTKTA